MKKISTTLFMILCSTLLSVTNAQEWEEMTELPGNARHHPITWSIDNYGYVMGGTTANTPSGIANADFYRYDASDDTWETLSDFPGPPRSFSISAVYNDKAYIGFGMTYDNEGIPLNDLWRYDPDTNDWEELESCPCEGRRHPTFSINEVHGKLYVGKGDNLAMNLGDWWEYDIATDTWEEKETFPGSNRHHPFHFSIEEFTYTGLGHDNSPAMARSDLYRYDPDTDTWDQMADAPGGRIAGTQFSYGGYGFVLSGDGMHHQPTNPSVFWRYDPDFDVWDQLTPHPGVSRWAPGSFVINNYAYFIAGQAGGQQGTLRKDMWRIDLDAVDVLSTNNIAQQNPLQIYPNPVAEILYISGESIENTSVAVFDLTGKMLFEQNETTQIDVSSLSSGIYILHCTTELASYTMRFIKK